MISFPSEEWITLFKEKLNNNTIYNKIAEEWEGDFLFIISPDVNYNKEMIFYVDLWHGKCRKAYVTDKTHKAAFVFKGTYSNWKKIIKKEVDPIRGLIRGMFILEGDSKIILDQTKAAQELVNTASQIPVEFEDETNGKNY